MRNDQELVDKLRSELMNDYNGQFEDNMKLGFGYKELLRLDELLEKLESQIKKEQS